MRRQNDPFRVLRTEVVQYLIETAVPFRRRQACVVHEFRHDQIRLNIQNRPLVIELRAFWLVQEGRNRPAAPTVADKFDVRFRERRLQTIDKLDLPTELVWYIATRRYAVAPRQNLHMFAVLQLLHRIRNESLLLFGGFRGKRRFRDDEDVFIRQFVRLRFRVDIEKTRLAFLQGRHLRAEARGLAAHEFQFSVRRLDD